jgi:hypothetical protein
MFKDEVWDERQHAVLCRWHTITAETLARPLDVDGSQFGHLLCLGDIGRMKN